MGQTGVLWLLDREGRNTDYSRLGRKRGAPRLRAVSEFSLKKES